VLCRAIIFLGLALTTLPGASQPGDGLERAALRSFLDQTINSADSFEDRYDAEVWLVDMSARLDRYVTDPEQRLLLLQDVHFAASRADLPPELVLAVIEVESHFNRFAISPVGAQGMMQVMPFWKDEIGRPGDNLTNQKTNLEYGCRILQFYLQRKKGRLHEALAAYNGSSGRRVYSDKVYKAWKDHWSTAPLDWSQ
jgi:soluble lytic murein transglycosylase-like protein